MPKKISIGIDCSLTSTGLVALENGEYLNKALIKTKPEHFNSRIQRLRYIVEHVEAFCANYERPGIAIEGYSYGSAHKAHSLGELGGAIRLALDHTGELLEIPPSLLKQLTTGKGSANKKDMIAAVASRWGWETKSHDLADAFALAKMQWYDRSTWPDDRMLNLWRSTNKKGQYKWSLI